MELRRPRLADKETVLEMMAEFEQSQSAHDGGFWDAENFVYEEWLESNQNHEMGINLPEGWVPDIQLVAFAKMVKQLDSSTFDCVSMTSYWKKEAILAIPSVPLKEARGMPRKLSVKVCKLLKKRTSIVLW